MTLIKALTGRFGISIFSTLLSMQAVAQTNYLAEWLATQPKIVQEHFINADECRYPENIDDMSFDGITCLNDEGVSWIMIEGKHGLLDAQGNWVMLPKYDLITAFSEGRAVVEEGEHKFLINSKGEWLADINANAME